MATRWFTQNMDTWNYLIAAMLELPLEPEMNLTSAEDGPCTEAVVSEFQSGLMIYNPGKSNKLSPVTRWVLATGELFLSTKQ